jgi:hypothetical protein
VTGQLVYIREQAFFLRMICREANPKATYTNPDDPVYKDSCLEAFIDFCPDKDGPGYVNFEMNANGAMLCAIGPNRAKRRFLKDISLAVPHPVALVTDAFWQVELTIPLDLIIHLYGPIDFVPGTRLRGNFYKCGDQTGHVEYGVWSKIGLERPDYHAPQFFGELIMG